MHAGNTSTVQGMVVDSSAAVWNHIVNGGSSGSSFGPLALTGANGMASGALLRGNLGYAATNAISQDDKDAAMMAAWYGFSGAESLTVSHLPKTISEQYYVIVYGDANGSRRMSYTIGSETQTIHDRGDFTGSFEQGQEYVLFSGLSGDSFTLTGNSSGARSAVSGIQIVAGLPPATITHFDADDEYVTSGTEVEFSWNVANYDSLTLSPGHIDVSALSTDGVGSIMLPVDATTEYTLTATKGPIVKTAAITVGVGAPRPNLIIFLVDDLGIHDSSVSFILDGKGNPVTYKFNDFYQTPNLETLARTGMRFTSAYAHTICSPSRASIMTGRTGARHAITNFIPARDPIHWPTNWRADGLDATDVTLAETLRRHGYRTIHCGKGHFSSAGSGMDIYDLGFDINIGGVAAGEPDSYTDWSEARVPNVPGSGTGIFLTQALALEANQAIEAAANDGQPFFLYMSFYAVHAVNTQRPRFPINPHASGDYSAALNEEHQGFATMVEGMDMAVGSIRQKVIDLGLGDDTFVIFLGDNGSDSPAAGANGLSGGIFGDFPIRGRKGFKWEGGARIPFIASWVTNDASNAFQQATPILANSIEDDLIAIWDVPVTMLATAGIAKPSGFGEDGHDLSAYFAGAVGAHRPQEIAIHFPHNRGGNGENASYFSWIRKGDMKLIYHYYNNDHQLYDLSADPTESINRASSDPECTMELTRRLAQLLDREWGFGPLKPTNAVRVSDKVIEIPHTAPFAAVDLDADGVADIHEDRNLNGLVDGTEMDPDTFDRGSDVPPKGRH
jgi:arylsulfatase A-like enzyme